MSPAGLSGVRPWTGSSCCWRPHHPLRRRNGSRFAWNSRSVGAVGDRPVDLGADAVQDVEAHRLGDGERLEVLLGRGVAPVESDLVALCAEVPNLLLWRDVQDLGNRHQRARPRAVAGAYANMSTVAALSRRQSREKDCTKIVVAAIAAIALLSGCASQKVSVEGKKISVESSATSLLYDVTALEELGRSVIKTLCKNRKMDKGMSAGELIAAAKNAKGFVEMLFPVNTVTVTADC